MASCTGFVRSGGSGGGADVQRNPQCVGHSDVHCGRWASAKSGEAMKRAKLGKAKATQSKAKAKTVEQYLAQTQEPARSTLNRVRETIRSAVPTDVEEVMSYGIPAFKWKKMVVWYAAFADHCSLFPTASVIAKFKEEL